MMGMHAKKNVLKALPAKYFPLPLRSPNKIFFIKTMGDQVF
jgi:hypothetical protein